MTETPPDARTRFGRWLAGVAAVALIGPPAGAQYGGFVDTITPYSPQGVRAVIDVPSDLHIKNVGGSDGAGLCVFTSMQVGARWQYIPEMEGFQSYMQHRPGGGYPSKVTKVMQDFCASKGVTVSYIQHTGGDMAFLDLCYRTRRSPSVTYDGRDNFYRGSVAHMVSGAHLDSSVAAIIDNNRPGKWTWMSRADFQNRWTAKGGGWAVVFLGPPPPPGADGDVPPPPAPTPVPNPTPPAPRPRPCPGPGPCPGEPSPLDGFPVIGEDGYRWEYRSPGHWWLWKGETFVGSAWPDGWHPATSPDKVILKPTGEPPIPVPVTAGVDFDELQSAGWFRYWINGAEVTQAEAYAALAANAIPDDSGHHFLSAVGSLADAKAQLSVIQATPAGSLLANKAHVRAFPPDSWVARRLKPGITFQSPAPKGGQVLWQGTDPASGELSEAIRKALDPNWRPAPPPAPPTPPAPTPAPGPTPKPGPNQPGEPLTGSQAIALGAIGYAIRRAFIAVTTLRSQTR